MSMVTALSNANVGRIAAAEPSGPPPEAPLNVTPPGIDNMSPARGETLTAIPGTWTGVPTPTLTYEWVRNNEGGVVIGTEASLVVPDSCIGLNAEIGIQILVRETATNTGGTDNAESASTDAVVSVPFNVECGVPATEAIGTPIALGAACQAYPIATFAYEYFLNDVTQGDPGASIDTSGLSAGDEVKLGVIATNTEGASAQIFSNVCTITEP